MFEFDASNEFSSDNECLDFIGILYANHRECKILDGVTQQFFEQGIFWRINQRPCFDMYIAIDWYFTVYRKTISNHNVSLVTTELTEVLLVNQLAWHCKCYFCFGSSVKWYCVSLIKSGWTEQAQGIPRSCAFCAEIEAGSFSTSTSEIYRNYWHILDYLQTPYRRLAK